MIQITVALSIDHEAALAAGREVKATIRPAQDLGDGGPYGPTTHIDSVVVALDPADLTDAERAELALAPVMQDGVTVNLCRGAMHLVAGYPSLIEASLDGARAVLGTNIARRAARAR